jgi:protein-S-isoprenylcysteine O-methyltransferase Ste14
MHSPKLWNDLTLLWIIFTAYLAFSAGRVRIKKAIAIRAYLLESCGILPAALLVFWPKTHFSILASRFENDFTIEAVGFVIAIAGLAFAAWSRNVLGRNWSARALIRTNHELVTFGPYAYLRHPLYTGLLVALAGSALVSGEYGALLGWILLVGIFAIKARREEHLLESEFGALYSTYRKATGFLLPRIAHV